MRTCCGVFVLKAGREPAFLLLRRGDRWDLPKGRLEGDESELQCAVRELFEETRLDLDDVSFDPTFRWTRTLRRKDGGKKRVVFFLAAVEDGARVRCREHDGHAWVPWPTTTQVGAPTIDALVRAVDAHFRPARPRAA